MAEQMLDVRSVAIIGAGVSGVAAAIHLKRAGLEVTVFERNERAGGIWVYNENGSHDAAYPSVVPSRGDAPEYEGLAKSSKSDSRQDSPMSDIVDANSCERSHNEALLTSFAPPGPCYVALKNNVSTTEMEMTIGQWPDGTTDFMPHHVMADYIQASAVQDCIADSFEFRTRVNRVRKIGKEWEVSIARLLEDGHHTFVLDSKRCFDAVVVAAGHYHASNIPDLTGLSDWKQRFPGAISHSKLYRDSSGFENQNVLLIGAGVSSMDIARDLGGVAKSIYQSSRGGPYDLPSHLLPDNGARIGAINSFGALDSCERATDGSIPGEVILASGDKLCQIH